MAYLDSSPTKQVAFSKIFSSIYQPNDKKLFVSLSRKKNQTNLSFYKKIIVIRRWFDDTIELVNTQVEFDETSLNEFQRNNFNILADIEANLKLFVTTRWQNAKKFTLPTIFNLDERNEVN